MNKIKSKKVYVNIDKKSMKGITLISLVITIVIMLILATVSINLIIGNNGLFTKAKTSASKYKEKNIRESIEHLIAEWNIQKEDDSQKGIEETTLYAFLQSKVPDELDSIKESDDNYKIVKDGYTILLSKEGTLTSITTYDPNAIEYKKWDGKIAEEFSEGDGSQDNPYIINLPSELAYLSKSVLDGNTYEGKYIKLNENIDLDNIEWTPIGDYMASKYFLGNLDGNYKCITNINVNLPDKNYIGFLGNAKNATIQNLKLIDGSIKGSSAVAGLVGYLSDTTITNCSNQNVTVIGTNTIGGIVGTITNCTISKCYNNATIKSTNNCAGGIIAYVNAGALNNIYSVYNTGTINGNKMLGGIIGEIKALDSTAIIRNIYNEGEIIGNESIGDCIGRVYLNLNKGKTNYINLYNIYGNNNQYNLIYDTSINYIDTFYGHINYSYMYTTLNSLSTKTNEYATVCSASSTKKVAEPKETPDTCKINLSNDYISSQEFLDLLNAYKNQSQDISWILKNNHPVLDLSILK